MAATQDDIRTWLLRGKAEEATHLIVACDTFDWEDYPVYVKPSEQSQDIIAKYDNVNMQRVMEVYNLSLDIDIQLQSGKAWNL